MLEKHGNAGREAGSLTNIHHGGSHRAQGTNTVRAYMHGYFMDTRLYRKAKAIAKPFEYETYKEAQMCAGPLLL